jgi:hypothetical protein
MVSLTVMGPVKELVPVRRTTPLPWSVTPSAAVMLELMALLAKSREKMSASTGWPLSANAMLPPEMVVSL